MIDRLFTWPCRNPAAKRSPAPVRSTIFKFLLTPHSIISSPLIAIAPFSPLVIIISLWSSFENLITSLKFLASINDVISCSLAKLCPIYFLPIVKNEVYVYLHKLDQKGT